MILSLDTSSAGGSAAIVRDGLVVLERAGDHTRMHGERLPRELIDLLDAAGLSVHDVDAYAVAIGPGSFTGLRVGIATVQGLALAQDRLVAPVSTFEALARPLLGRDPVAVWIDAHRGEVFAALVSAAGDEMLPPTALPPSATLDAWASSLSHAPRIRFAGDGAIKYRGVITARLGSAAQIADPVPLLAGTVGVIASNEPPRAVRPHALVPLYVRRPDALLARDARSRAR